MARPTTDLGCDASGVLDDAARWLLQRDQRNQGLFPELKQRHGLTTPQCIGAIRLANLIRQGGADGTS
jgi:hypothetical protein